MKIEYTIHIYFNRKKKQRISPYIIALASILSCLLVSAIVIAIVIPLTISKSKCV